MKYILLGVWTGFLTFIILFIPVLWLFMLFDDQFGTALFSTLPVTFLLAVLAGWAVAVWVKNRDKR